MEMEFTYSCSFCCYVQIKCENQHRKFFFLLSSRDCQCLTLFYIIVVKFIFSLILYLHIIILKCMIVAVCIMIP